MKSIKTPPKRSSFLIPVFKEFIFGGSYFFPLADRLNAPWPRLWHKPSRRQLESRQAWRKLGLRDVPQSIKPQRRLLGLAKNNPTPTHPFNCRQRCSVLCLHVLLLDRLANWKLFRTFSLWKNNSWERGNHFSAARHIFVACTHGLSGRVQPRSGGMGRKREQFDWQKLEVV